ncbi:MAG: glycosyltransferase [Sphingobacteriales bacterium]|nr:glycosyltransferase [Sphingobacteriales bacterium]
MNVDSFAIHWPMLVLLIFIGMAVLQVSYYLFFFSRIAFYHKPKQGPVEKHPVSVIVCARDEAPNLATNLPGILVQHYPFTHEVLVVNDNSYDDSKYVLEKLQQSFPQLRILELTQEANMIPGKKFPLSMGIKSAKHEMLLLTDADCVPASEHWIESMQAAYQPETEIVLGYGAYHKQKGLLNKLIRWETFHSALQYLSFAQAGIAYMGVGRNLSYHRSVFYRQKGFSAHYQIPGGDDDLFINKAANKKNTRINIDPNSFTLSKAANSWQQWRKQKQRHYSTSKHYRWQHQLLLGAYAASQFLFYPLFIWCLFTGYWMYAISIFGFRLLLQSIVYYKSMYKLKEHDLWPFFILFDIWMFFYYLIFASSLFKKPPATWK